MRATKPTLRATAAAAGVAAIRATGVTGLGEMTLYCDAPGETIFTENETNNRRLFDSANATPYVKDAFHRYLIGGETRAVNLPAVRHRCDVVHYTLELGPGRVAVGPAPV